MYLSDLVKGKLIGQGYFGEVHEGSDALHKKVAIKTLKRLSHFSQQEWELYQSNLVSEAQSLRDAKHRNVVNVLHIVRSAADNSVHMVVEFCGGGSLEDEYKKGPISVAKVRQIIADVCSGLSCIHNRGMVHRDIKPGNLLSSGSKWLIGDFGLVTADLAYGYASAQGYLDHLPTETHRDGITSIKSDVWALGMTIYRLLHGNDFYQEEYAHRDIPRLIMQGGFAARLLWLPHIPTDWRRFIRKSMHDLSEQRFRDMFHMSQAAGALSIKPDWKCNYATNLVHWTAQKGNRTLEVFWEVLSPNKHRWFARSSAGIRSRAIGGSKGIVSKRQATVELERFFQAHA